MVAACPEGLNDYIALATRIRSEIKTQSRHWDLKALPVRQRLYRLLFGARMALEEVMLQAPASVEIPQSIPGADVDSRTPSASFLATRVHSGDILLSRGGAPTSALIARGNDYPGSFSHVALVHVDEHSHRAFVVESHIERGVTVSSLEDYLADKKLRIVVLRIRPDLPALLADPMLPHKAAASARAQAESTHIPYDFAMDYQRHDAQFCSEVVSAAYEPAGVHLWQGMTFISSSTVTAWLGSLGVRHFETLEPADLEYDSQLYVVAEWRDLNTLFKAHVDDAVTDVMLDEAKPGETLPYQLSMLPVTRLAKAYSFILNLFGKVGPVPEGMSATTALRVKRFRTDHAGKLTGIRLSNGAVIPPGFGHVTHGYYTTSHGSQGETADRLLLVFILVLAVQLEADPQLGRHVQRAADCHTRSGSAFTYTAFFPNDAVEIKGETRSSRTMRAAERWADCRG